MSGRPKPEARTYRSPLRAAKAATSKRRIVEAAGELFAADGYGQTTMNAVADRAGVSVESVYQTGSKAALLLGAFEQLLTGELGSHTLTEQTTMVDIMSIEDTSAAIGRYVEFMAETNARLVGLWRAMHHAADSDPQVAAVIVDINEKRFADFAMGVRWARSRGLLGADDDPDEAAAVWSLLTSPETWDHLVGLCGWGASQYKKWLRRALNRLVITGNDASGAADEDPPPAVLPSSRPEPGKTSV